MNTAVRSNCNAHRPRWTNWVGAFRNTPRSSCSVNLEAGYVETKRKSLRCLTTVQIVDQAHGCLLCRRGNIH